MPSRLTALVRLAIVALLLPIQAMAHTPHEDIFVVGVSPNFLQDGTVLAVLQMSEHRVVARSQDGGRSWQTYGSALAKQTPTSLRLSPSFAFDGTAFCGTVRTGLWRSKDTGASWERVALDLPTDKVSSVAFSPNYRRDGTIFFATDAGLYKSDDDGETITLCDDGLTESNLTALAVVPTLSGDTRLYTGRNTLHVSIDAGDTWQVLNTLGNEMRDIALSPDVITSGELALSFSDGGLWRSVDGGQSFPAELSEVIPEPLNDLRSGPSGKLYACSANLVFSSESFLEPLTPVSPLGIDPLSDQTTDHYHKIGIGPTGPTRETVFLAAFEGLFSSLDPTDRWAPADIYSQRVNRQMIISPTYKQDRTLALGNFGGGLVLSVDAGKTMQESFLGVGGSTSGGGGGTPSGSGPGSALSPGLVPQLQLGGREELKFSAHGTDVTSLWTGQLAVSPNFAADGTILIGHQGLWLTNDRGQSWTPSTLPEDVFIVRGVGFSPAFAQDNTAYFGTSSFGPLEPNQGFFRSTDGGQTWEHADGGLGVELKSREFGFSPGFLNDRTMFLATRNEGIFRSLDAGDNWTQTNTGLQHPAIRAMRVSPNYIADQTLFIATQGGGLYKSTDGGDSWEQRNTGIINQGGIDAEGVAVSPNYAVDQTLFISTQRSGAWVSRDGAQTWQPVNDGLPIDMQRNIEISPDFENDQTLYLNTHDWVWRSQDAGGNWERMPGLLRVPDEHPSVVPNEPWQRVGAEGAHGTAISISEEPGDWFELEFFGDSVTWFANTGPANGRVRVSVDGGPTVLVDTYSEESALQLKLFEQSFEELDWHTIRCTILSSKNRASTGTLIETDGFEYSF